MSNTKLVVGQKIWVVERNYRGNSEEPVEALIVKVGRVYFEAKVRWNNKKFLIETMTESIDSSYKAIAYLTRQEIDEERELSGLANKFRTFFNGYGKPKLSLSQMRKIDEILTNPPQK